MSHDWLESLARWKYRTTRQITMITDVRGYACKTEYIQLWDDGRLILAKGYAWDGPSGPTIDTADSLRASAGHDALYQLIRLGAIPADMRIIADRDLRRWCIEDGMPAIRAEAWYHAVRAFGGRHAAG